MTPPISTPCKIVLMDLAEGAQPLAIDSARYRSAGIFFLLDGVPLGHKYLSSAELPLTAEQAWEVAIEAVLPALTGYLLRGKPGALPLDRFAAADPIAAFRELMQSAEWQRSTDSVSVVICTHERPAALARCLASLARLRDQPLEVLVVDNAPKTDATRAVVDEYPGVRYKAEPRPGLSHARNAGVRASHGELIAFTDDDVEVGETWLRELIRPFTDPAVMCTTGLVIPAEMETQPQSLFEHWLSFHRGYEPRRFGPSWMAGSRKAPPVWDIGAGASMAIRRSALEEVGGFDTRLGAGASGCSEDSELWYRLIAAGYVCEYVPASLVLHYHRADAASLRKQMRLYSRGHAAALILQFVRHRHPGNLVRLVLGLPLYYLRRLTASTVFPEWMPFWTTSVRGYLAGFFYLIGNSRDKSRELSRGTAGRVPVPVLSGSESRGDQ